jgi:hypothetical protein
MSDVFLALRVDEMLLFQLIKSTYEDATTKEILEYIAKWREENEHEATA